MALEMFRFIDEALNTLEDNFESLYEISKELSEFFEDQVLEHSEGYININSRVKTPNSLKEKILRYSYYNLYKDSIELFKNLSDLIGLRIECRFIEDEALIYNILTRYFNELDKDGFYYNKNNRSISLDLNGKQPEKQKNGFKIYKIDGKYKKNNKVINFELQIKALVNIFWGEIEHKIIYKNYNYMLGDGFLKDIMGSIKNNLSMIDHQLLIIYNQFNKSNTTNPVIRKAQSESLLSKIIYDMFSTRMKSSIGVDIDFKRPCDTIMSYIFRGNNIEKMDEYGDTLVKAFSRLNEINKEYIDFNSIIEFERRVEFNNEFSNMVGELFLESINKEFLWNLFFRILFIVEKGDNSKALEKFIEFLRERFIKNPEFLKMGSRFKEEEISIIKNDVMRIIAVSFKTIKSIDIIYEENIDKINEALSKIIELIMEENKDYYEYIVYRDIYNYLLYLKLLSIFNCKLDSNNLEALIWSINKTHMKDDLNDNLLKYLDHMSLLSKIKPQDILSLLNHDHFTMD